MSPDTDWIKTTARGVFGSLTTRLVILLTFALLPLSLISVYQTRSVIEEAHKVSRNSLMARTNLSAAAEREVIREGLGAAEGLAKAAPLLSAQDCVGMLARFTNDNPHFVFASYAQADGQMDCASTGDVLNLSSNPMWPGVRSGTGPFLQVTALGELSGRSVVILGQRIFNDGVFAGVVALSLPHKIANLNTTGPDSNIDLMMASINMDGLVVAATGGFEGAPQFLPESIPLEELAQRTGKTFDAKSASGEMRTYAVSSMIDGTLSLVGSWPSEKANLEAIGQSQGLAYVVPLLMWVAGVAVAYFGTHEFVIRHVQDLRSAMRQYAMGDRSADQLHLAGAPAELEEAQHAFNRLAHIISKAEVQQTKDLRDKEVLLREVHHRVKNNLQMIASIMNLQARNAKSSEAKFMLAGLQRRVRGLATLHRTLYTKSEMTTVDGAELVRAVASDVAQLSDSKQMHIETDLCSVELYPDQGVPLSMLLAEALTNAVKYVGIPPGGSAEISISLTCDPQGLIELVVRNSRGKPVVDAGHDPEASTGLGERLMRAFATQLEGTLDLVETDVLHSLTLRFQNRGFDNLGAKS